MKQTVAIDTSFLTLLLDPKALASVPNGAEIVADLVADLSREKAKIIIPAPVLTEVLMKSPKAGTTYLEKLKPYACFQVRPFDELAAVELSQALLQSVKEKKRKLSDLKKETITFDRQIVAVALVHGATVIYSDDNGLCDFAESCGLKAKRLRDLRLKPKQLALPSPEDSTSPN